MSRGIRSGLIGLIAGLLLINTTVQGQKITETGADLNAIKTAMAFLTIAPDSRSGALGDIGAASTADVNSQHWNIAKYPFIENSAGFAISYTPWLRSLIPDINLAYLSGYYKLDERQVISGSLRYFSLGKIVFTDDVGVVQMEGNPNEFAIDAGYSRLLSDNFSMGLAFRFGRSDLTSGYSQTNMSESRPGITYGADLGLYYQNDLVLDGRDAQWALGVAFTNLGSPVSYTVDSEATPVPTNLRIGGRFTYDLDEYNSITGLVEINKLMVSSPPVYHPDVDTVDSNGDRIVIRGKEPPSSVVAGMFTSFWDAPGFAKANNPDPFNPDDYSRFAEEMAEIAWSLGVEYWYREQFSIRAGYFNEHSAKGNRKYAAVGVGLQLNVFSLDFSYLIPTNGNNSPLANTLRFTLGFNL